MTNEECVRVFITDVTLKTVIEIIKNSKTCFSQTSDDYNNKLADKYLIFF